MLDHALAEVPMTLLATDLDAALRPSECHSPAATSAPVVGVRLSLAEDGDRASVRGLAQLTAATPPHGPALVAELDGEVVAAVGLSDGLTVAHPSRAHPAILTHLRLRRLEVRLIGSIWGA